MEGLDAEQLLASAPASESHRAGGRRRSSGSSASLDSPLSFMGAGSCGGPWWWISSAVRRVPGETCLCVCKAVNAEVFPVHSPKVRSWEMVNQVWSSM